MYYLAHQPIRRPVFGVGLYHESGFWLSGPNTNFDGVEIPEISGTGAIDYHIPSLPLLAGRYLISATVVDTTMLHTYDMHDRMYRLTVHSDALRERYGVMSIPSRWEWRAEQPAPAALQMETHE